jgi:hypothetical protein
MDTLDQIVGVLSQLDDGNPARLEFSTSPSGRGMWVAADGGTFAYRRKVQHLDHLLARAERDGTLETIFSPGYPPVRIDVAADDSRAVLVVDDPRATVDIAGREARIDTQGRERQVTLPFAPASFEQKTVSGLTTVVFS